METTELGRTGLQVSVIGLGTSGYRADDEPLHAGLAAGATFIDTAESYGTEELVGRAIRGRRHEVFLATKVSPQHLRHSDVIRAAEDSLRRLAVDYIDLYQVHWPNALVPIEETVAALERLVDDGKVRYIGVSNYGVRDLERTRAALTKHPLVANQIHLSLINRQVLRDVVPYCLLHGITVVAYRPLGLGPARLEERDRAGALRAVAERTEHTVPQVALNWCLGHGNVVAIPKASSVEHVRDNCAAGGWRLSDVDRRLLEAAVKPQRHRSALEQSARRVARRWLARGRGRAQRR